MGFAQTPKDERPRERLLQHGAAVLSDAEILAVLLGTGTVGQSVLELSRGLLSDGWTALSRRTPAELMRVRGLGQAKSATLAAALEIGHRVDRAALLSVQSPQDAVRLVSDLRDRDQEEFRVIFLNSKGWVLGIETLFRGGLDRVEVFPREIFRNAVARSAASIVVAHNHPSGDPAPSRQDRELTRRLEACGDLMGIAVLDHVIVGRSRHVSLHQGELTELS
ncbi:MAG: JAB domain-containing protein [Sulfobacillus acidophilus]|uniref:JAB domain-containing protein n=1 Tax=Sulfobacillus acidophilus TaxID=53633 RepID=A0A2T2WIL5_9FIRM|nr:MAG: JAB domain-containing protein [Sulfobacillus acidophilus]